MLITGYHGTKRHFANKIIQEGKYHISKGDKEWLDNGPIKCTQIIDYKG